MKKTTVAAAAFAALLTSCLAALLIDHTEATTPTKTPEPTQAVVTATRIAPEPPHNLPNETPAPTPEPAPEANTQPHATETPAPEPAPQEEEEWTSLGTFDLTAYCACEECCGYWATIRPLDENGNPIVYTASGAVAQEGLTIAVDPDVIPYGTEVKIGDRIYIAQDTGGAIVGNRIDVYYASHDAALTFGIGKYEIFIQSSGICTETPDHPSNDK